MSSLRSFRSFILDEKSEKSEKPKITELETEKPSKPSKVADSEKPEGSEGSEENVVSLSDELIEIISDLTDEEKEILLMHAYALIFNSEEPGEEEDSEDSEDSEEDADETEEVVEASIKHLTGTERTQGKLKRRTPKWKKRMKIRYIKNKKCPKGTTYSSVTKSCTRKDIDLSRMQKMISKMKIRLG